MVKTRIKPCESCGGKLGPIFYVVKVAQAVVNVGAVNRHVGMTQHFQGHAALAAVFSPDETLEEIAEGPDANRWPEATICADCFLGDKILANTWSPEG
jgi:hypothetical protein